MYVIIKFNYLVCRDELDSILLDLQVQLDGVLQRLQNDSQKLSNLSLPLSSYEDARGLFVFLKLRYNYALNRMQLVFFLCSSDLNPLGLIYYVLNARSPLMNPLKMLNPTQIMNSKTGSSYFD